MKAVRVDNYLGKLHFEGRRKSSVEGCEEEEMEHMGERVLSITLSF